MNTISATSTLKAWRLTESSYICTSFHEKVGQLIFFKDPIKSTLFFIHHHHIAVMELGHLLTRSGLTYPEVDSKFYHDSFCRLGNNLPLSWVIYYKAFYLHVVSSFSRITVICLKLVLFLIRLQFVYLFCNLSRVYPAVLLMYLISAAVILLASLVLIV